jgi:hypothetical protein
MIWLASGKVLLENGVIPLCAECPCNPALSLPSCICRSAPLYYQVTVSNMLVLDGHMWCPEYNGTFTLVYSPTHNTTSTLRCSWFSLERAPGGAGADHPMWELDLSGSGRTLRSYYIDGSTIRQTMSFQPDDPPFGCFDQESYAHTSSLPGFDCDWTGATILLEPLL